MSSDHGGIALGNSPLARVRGGMDLCVHCGFCLQACPTYLALEDENDSPRGRIVLMHALLEGDIPPDDSALHTHISQCLGCRGCETACPSGVPFGHLLEATRATLREHKPTPLLGRMLLTTVATPLLLSVVMFFARLVRAVGIARLLSKMRGRAGDAFAMLAATTPSRFSQKSGRRAAPVTAAPHATRDSESAAGAAGNPMPATHVALFEGCVMRELYGHVHNASRNVLEANNYSMVLATGQLCCGALHAHSGDMEKAKVLARKNIAAFEASSAERVAVNAAGCGAMLREYALLLVDDHAWAERAAKFSQKVADITELLEQRGPVPGAAIHATVAYDAPCHLQHAQRVVTAPLAVFLAIPGLQVVQSPDNDKCCGAAGIYNLIEPQTSAAVLAPKLKELLEFRTDAVATGNPGCMMQIGAGLLRSGSPTPVVHPVELLDFSYRGRRENGSSGK